MILFGRAKQQESPKQGKGPIRMRGISLAAFPVFKIMTVEPELDLKSKGSCGLMPGSQFAGPLIFPYDGQPGRENEAGAR